MNVLKPPPASPPALPPDLVARFAAIVGDKYAVTDPQEAAPYLTEERGLFSGHSPLILRPGSAAEVAAICKLATETRTALVPQGGNTGLVGGQMPHGEVVVSTRRLDKIRAVDTRSNTMTVEAGVILLNAQQRAAEAERLFPLSLGAEGSCTIGGNLSTNAGGIAALAYGVARDLVLGLEVVLADGRIMQGLSSLKKDNTGYDLRDLFVGAEGTLGIITAATLKLFPKPRSVETTFAAIASPADALTLLDISRNTAAGSLTSFELIPQIAIDFVVRHGPSIRAPLADPHPWHVLMEISSPRDDARDTIEAILSRGMEDGIVEDAVIAANLDQRAAFWKLREVISPAQKPEGGSIKHDISVPVAAIADFLARATPAVLAIAPGARPVGFGHLGDGNLHVLVGPGEGREDARHAVEELVYGPLAAIGGSVSAEHGIGLEKRGWLHLSRGAAEIETMKRLKSLFDPKAILNPGRVFAA